MTREKYEALVRKLEKSAAANPGLYKARVVALTALGYGYILLIAGGLLLLTLLVGALMVIGLANGRAGSLQLLKLEIPLLIFCFLVLKAFWVRVHPPEGTELTREQFPELFADVDALSQSLNAPKVHTIVLTEDFNAAMSQNPLLGVFGWYRNYLILGLPLMQTLPRDQFLAVVAHELGHLSGQHSRFSVWIYRVRATWGNLLDSLTDRGGRSAGVFRSFLRWYAPYYDASTFVLRRENEYAADRCSAEATSRQAAANALVNIELRGRYLSEHFWPDITRKSRETAAPPQDLFFSMASALSSPVPFQDGSRWLTEALRIETGYTDTHPSLSDRLKALNWEIAAPGDIAPSSDDTTSSADFYLGARQEQFARQYSEQWSNSIRPDWEQVHKENEELRRKLEELETKAARETLGAEEEFDRIWAIERLRGEAEAFPLYVALRDREPQHAPAQFAVGRLLLEKDDTSGIACIEKAMELEEAAVPDGCNLIYGFYRRQGRTAEAADYVRRYDQHSDKMDEARAERENVTLKDTFVAHQMPDEKLRELLAIIGRFDFIRDAYLARKEVRHFTDHPVYLLALDVKIKWYKMTDNQIAKMSQQVTDALQVEDAIYIAILAGQGKPWKKIKKVEGSHIYRKAG